jgi:hypothetical protein
MSKLNPQKASAYVGPGVLRKGGKITPVPNGPLIKKKGPFKGSTLKAGGVIKKAQGGIKQDKTAVVKPKVRGTIKNQPTYNRMLLSNTTKKDSIDYKKGYDFGQKQPKNNLQDLVESPTWSAGNAEGATDKRPKKKLSMKAGGMIKRADGSMSKRGLWDNIRANKGSGKKPTAAMLKQEKKIKAKK